MDTTGGRSLVPASGSVLPCSTPADEEGFLLQALLPLSLLGCSLGSWIVGPGFAGNLSSSALPTTYFARHPKTEHQSSTGGWLIDFRGCFTGQRLWKVNYSLAVLLRLQSLRITYHASFRGLNPPKPISGIPALSFAQPRMEQIPLRLRQAGQPAAGPHNSGYCYWNCSCDYSCY